MRSLLGWPELMTRFTAREQMEIEKVVGERDARFGVDSGKKAEERAETEELEIHPDADALWKKQ